MRNVDATERLSISVHSLFTLDTALYSLKSHHLLEVRPTEVGELVPLSGKG